MEAISPFSRFFRKYFRNDNQRKIGKDFILVESLVTDTHRFLSENIGNIEDLNIGEHGKNLTISFISYNRSDLSIKLLESIKNHIPLFKGEVLIVDNGSNFEEIEKLKKYIEKFEYDCQFIELGRNTGPSFARNLASKEAKYGWIMSLDNDVYFISNILPVAQKEIAVLNTHFMSLPLLNPDKKSIYAYGGDIFISKITGDEYLLEQRSIFKGKTISILVDPKPFYCNFMFGGANIAKKDTFLKLNGYDENMFIGYEDLEFSLRILREGYKLGCISALGIIHDHPKDKLDYEKVRWAKNTIKESADYFKKKHGYNLISEKFEKELEALNDELNKKES
jgi:GT2 family glycosyltransferase